MSGNRTTQADGSLFDALVRTKNGTYSIPEIDGSVCAIGNNVFEITAGDARFAVAGNAQDVDRVLREMFRLGAPHARLTKQGDGYLYAPWNLVIQVDPELSWPGAGNGFRALWGGVTLLIPRLRGFREFLRLLDPPVSK
jgi:hypothetical protein